MALNTSENFKRSVKNERAEGRRRPDFMPEDFSQKSSDSIWAFIGLLKSIMDGLRSELPLSRIDWGWHANEDKQDSVTIDMWGTGFEGINGFLIQLRPLNAHPEPSELYPSNCLARGIFRVSPSEEIEICASGNDWMVHHQEKWIPFSASYVAFLIGKAQSFPAIPPVS